MRKANSQNTMQGMFDFPEVQKPKFESQLFKLNSNTSQKTAMNKINNSINNNKIVTQSTEQVQTLRSSITKPQINSERFMLDLDASMVYIHKEKIQLFEELESQRIQQLLKDIQTKIPQISDKINHYILLASQYDSDKVNPLVNQFVKVVEQLMQIQEEKSKEIKEYQFALKQSREQQTNTTRMIEDQAQMIKYMEKESHNAKNVTKTFQRSNELAVINVQLEKKVELLTQNLQLLMNQNKDSLATQLQNKIDQLNKVIEQQQNKLYDANHQHIQFQQQISTLKQTEFKHQIQLKKLEDKIQDCETKLKEWQFQVQYSKEQRDQYRELYFMTYEDLQMNKLNTLIERKQMQKSFEKIRMLQDRIDEMTVKRSKEVDAPFISRIEGDTIQLQAITKILDEDHVFQRYMMSSFLKNNQEYDVKLIDAYVDVKKTICGKDEEAELQTLRYNYPPFTQFLEKRIVDQESQYLQIRPISNNFMGLLRGILDGMFIEFQKPSFISFQGYVVSWLSTFTIDNHVVIQFPEDTKRVKIEEQLHTFYLDLMIPRLDKVWEVVQFRHFLNDVYSVEELYFYLQARYILRRGPWLETFDAIYGVVHYMKVQQAELVIHRFLEQFDKINQTLVIRAAHERIVEGKKGRKLIQTGFVLQLLMEIFRIDRVNRYKILSFAFPSQPITFRSFHKFVKGNFSKCTEGEVGEMWREVFMISNGIPNLNAFFTAAQSLFIKSLILPQIYSMPLLDQNKKLAFDELNFTTMKIQEQLKGLQDSDYEAFKSLVPQTYQEELIKMNQQLIPKQQIQYISPLDYIFKFTKVLLSIKYNQILADGLEEDGINRKGFITENFTQFLCSEITEMNKHLAKKQATLSDQEIRISRLQKFAQKKVKKIYVIMSSLLQSRIKQ